MSDDLDLDQLLEQTSAEMTVRHPVTGAPTGARVLIAGPEHPGRRGAIFARMRLRRAEMERTGKLSVPDPVEEEQDETELLATCTLGWRNLRLGGVSLAYTADAARQLFGDPKFRWLRDQVRAALDQRELFIGGSATV